MPAKTARKSPKKTTKGAKKSSPAKAPSKKKTVSKAKSASTSASRKAKKEAKSKKVDTRSCKVKGCKSPYRAKGYCDRHYKKWRNGAFGTARYKTCSDEMCRQPKAISRFGLCEEHYQSKYVKKERAAPKDEAGANEESAA